MRGADAEQAALDWLLARGLSLVRRNFRARGGEIDLIMRDGDSVVFVEVRARTGSSHGLAIETVDARKQARLIYAARLWLTQHPQDAERPLRFDVVALQGTAAPLWVRDAFGTP